MSGKQYWKNKIPYVTGNFLAMAVLAVFLLLGGNTRDSVLFILGSWLVILAVSMGAAYMCRRKQMDTLLESVNQLEEKYLIAEVTGLPERADDRVFYQVMKAAEKSMLERIGNMQREHKRIDDISAVYFIISIRQVFFLFKIDKNSYMFLCYLLIFTIALAFCVCW